MTTAKHSFPTLDLALEALDDSVVKYQQTLRMFGEGSPSFASQLSLSVEANQNRFKTILERIKDAIVSAYLFVQRIIRELITGHLARIDRLYDALIATERHFREMQKTGAFNGTPRTFIDNLSIARDLLTGSKISYGSVNQSHTTINTLITVANKTYSDRVTNNKRILERAGHIKTFEDLRQMADVPKSSEFTRESPTAYILEQLNVDEACIVTTSKPLPGNNTLAMVSTPANFGGLGFVNSDYGLRFVNTLEIDNNDRRLFRMPVLSGSEIKTMIFNIRRNLSDLRSTVDNVNQAEADLDRTRNVAKRLDLNEDSSRGDQDMLLAFITRSIRNDAKVLIATMTLSFDFLFACHQWIEKSIEIYQ